MKVKFQKGQELAKLSKCNARNLWEHDHAVRIFLLQDAQGQLGLEERKAEKRGARWKKMQLSLAVPSMPPALHNHQF